MSDFLRTWRAPDSGPSRRPPGAPDDLLAKLVDPWWPGRSLARSFCLATSRFALAAWPWLAATAFLSLGAVLVNTQLRPALPCCLYWLAGVAATSAIGMPCERYMVVAEPMLYVLLTVSLFTVASLRFRTSRASVARADRMRASRA